MDGSTDSGQDVDADSSEDRVETHISYFTFMVPCIVLTYVCY
jgi:hypothetical protein